MAAPYMLGSADTDGAMGKVQEFEVILLDDRRQLIRLASVMAETEQAALMQASDLTARAGAAGFQMRRLPSFGSPYHPPFSRLHRYNG
jgi:hypothetical protein